MKNKSKKESSLNNENNSNLLVTFYSIMAVIFVLIPEWIAELGISIENDQFKNKLPKYKYNLQDNPYLYTSTLSIKDLRLLAYKLKIHGYSSHTKVLLIKRILKRLRYKRLLYFIEDSLK